jgi:hypothetical protein
MSISSSRFDQIVEPQKGEQSRVKQEFSFFGRDHAAYVINAAHHAINSAAARDLEDFTFNHFIRSPASSIMDLTKKERLLNLFS